MSPEKFLLVDDNTLLRASLAKLIGLWRSEAVIEEASNGKEALEKAKTEKPAIIFLDIIMPDMDGYEACRKLAEDPATKGIPIVFVTSKGEKADKVWGQMQGAKAYLVKPVNADQVVDQLKALA